MTEAPIHIAIVEDDPVFRKMALQALNDVDGYSVESFPTAAEFNAHDAEFDMVIIDYNLPDSDGLTLIQEIKKANEKIKTLIVSGQTDVEVVVNAYALGADKYIVKNENCLPQLQNSVSNLAKIITLRKEVAMLRNTILDRAKYDRILGNSPAILKVLNLIAKAENSNILVLLTGNSGTGKELVAQAIHYNSSRKKKPFVPVNMAAIPKDLTESELFGHEKGAFTGAIAKRVGKFEEANGGTLFLDEIGEMDLDMQVKLLRILEDKQLVRVGSNSSINLDLRIIAATNRDLTQLVAEGSFREELYYRLQGFLIHLPDLRERDEDILLLAKVFLEDAIKENGLPNISIGKQAAKILVQHKWPGNVRELKSVIERAALLTNDNEISEDDLMLRPISGTATDLGEDDLTLDEYKNKLIQDYLKRYDNNIELVAQKLNIGKATIYRMLKREETPDLEIKDQ
jgi:DNA-binding NtrC family response regulator